jgi:hypothetical protein
MSGYLLNRREVRRVALEACKQFGIPATIVRKKIITSIEHAVRQYIKNQAVMSVKDGQKTILSPLP